MLLLWTYRGIVRTPPISVVRIVLQCFPLLISSLGMYFALCLHAKTHSEPGCHYLVYFLFHFLTSCRDYPLLHLISRWGYDCQRRSFGIGFHDIPVPHIYICPPKKLFSLLASMRTPLWQVSFDRHQFSSIISKCF